jgi:DNA-binding ferritin-like protein (Dps family)
LGIVGTAASFFMIGLKKFNDTAPDALKGLGSTILALQEAILLSYNAILGKKDSEGGISQEALSPLEGVAAFFSLILLAITIVPLILVIAMVAVLGAVATAASKFIDGLKKFTSEAPGALSGLPSIIISIKQIVDSSSTLFEAKNDTIAQKILNVIPGLGTIAAVIGVLGKLAAVIAVVGAIGLLAMAADNVSKYLPALKKFGDAETLSAFNSFKDGIGSIGIIAEAANELDSQAKPASFTSGGLKGMASRLFGGNTSGLASQLGTIVAVLESVSSIAEYSGTIQDNIENLRKFGGYKTIFGIFRTGLVEIIGQLSGLVTDVTEKTKNMPTGGVKGFLSNIWGGSNSGLTTALNTILGIFESLAKLSEEAGAVIGKIESLGDMGTKMTTLMNEFVPGILQVFRIVGFEIDSSGTLTLKNEMLFTENFWKRLEDVLDEIPGVMEEINDITKASKKINFKVNFQETIIDPILKLDPAIQKLNDLKNATKELNAELKKLTNENKNSLKTLADMGKSNNKSLLGINSSNSDLNMAKNMFEQDDNGLLEFIADDVHGIAQKVIIGNQRSWTDKTRPT